jgi:hypothetical protein
MNSQATGPKLGTGPRPTAPFVTYPVEVSGPLCVAHEPSEPPMPRRCSSTASQLPHAPAGQGDAGGRAPKRDGDVVADLTGARRQ